MNGDIRMKLINSNRQIQMTLITLWRLLVQKSKCQSCERGRCWTNVGI